MDLEIQIPESWQKSRIREVGNVITGRTPNTKRDEFYGGNYNLISPADLDKSKYVSTAHRRLTDLGFSECRALPKNTVLVGCIGNVGKLGMVSDERSATNQQINAVICNQKNDSHFVYYCFLENRTRLELAADKTTVPILNKTNFENFEIAIPPLAEQRKIAAVLGLVQRVIEQQDRIISLTTELKKSLMHKLFTEGLRGEPQKQTEIGPVPESWEITRLDDFCVLQRGFDITKKEQFSGNVPVVSSGGISSYHNVAKVKGPGVIIGRKGTLGTVHFIDVDYWPHDTTLWVRDFKGHDPLFTAHFLKTLSFERFNSGASNPTLNRNTVHAELVAYPDIEEQENIGRIIRTVEDKAGVHELKRRSLADLFRTLLHQLMTAQIRVHDIDVEGILEQVSGGFGDGLSPKQQPVLEK